MEQLLIKNANIVTESDIFLSDILIENEKIKAIGKFDNVEADQIIEASGKFVMPGAIDASTHMDLQVNDEFKSVDSFYTGTIAAACGGTTTIIDHVGFGPENCNLHYSINEYHEKAKESVIDYGFHGVIQHINNEILSEMEHMIKNEGIMSFTAYTTYDFAASDTALFELLVRMKKCGGVLAVHCENDAIVRFLRNSFIQTGRKDAIYHSLSRPPETESESVGRLLRFSQLAGDSNLYITHTSSKDAIKQVRFARENGFKNVRVETCPQYLILNDSVYSQRQEVALKYLTNPPLRSEQDQEELWKAVANKDIDVIATDHCPFLLEDKLKGIDDFTKAPVGIPGVEERFKLIFSEGVMERRISLNDFVRVMCSNPAKIFGMYPKKGTVMPGSDADLVIVDSTRSEVIKKETLHSSCDYSPYEGYKVNCAIDYVILRGKPIVKYGEFVGQSGDGQFISRKPVKN